MTTLRTRASAARAAPPLAATEPAREQRKVVSVLVCDVVGSTALGESTDPEALRARMRRYFEDLRTIRLRAPAGGRTRHRRGDVNDVGGRC
jgi:class 3 adenylate cyclase